MFKASTEKWSEIRARGKRAYIIKKALEFGFVLGVVMSIPDVLYEQKANWHLSILVTFAIATVAGALGGLAMWAFNEHEYKQHGQE